MCRLNALILFAVLDFVFAISSYAANETEKQYIRKTENFVVYGWTSGYLLVERAAAEAEIAYEKLSKELGLSENSKRKIPIIIYRTHQDFLNAIGADRRSRIVGLATYGSEIIDIDASDILKPMSEVIPHEIAHIVVGRILRGNSSALPRWMNEGIAVYFTSESDIEVLPYLSDAASEGKLIPMGDLSSAFGNDKTSGLAYAQSASIVEFIESKYGKGTIRKILAELAATGSFNDSVFRITGQRPEAIYEEWEKTMNRRFGAWRWARRIPESVWVIMLFTALAAFYAFTLKKRRIAKKFEEEELAERKWPFSNA